jgi:hypothetical protein
MPRKASMDFTTRSPLLEAVAWKLSPTMGAADVTETLDQALAITGVDQVRVKHRPRLLSDNGPAPRAARARAKLEIAPGRRQLGPAGA